MEKKKFEKVKETLSKTEEELKDLKKVNISWFFPDNSVQKLVLKLFYTLLRFSI